MTSEHLTDGIKLGIDALSVVTLLGTLSSMLPSIAALFTIVWTTIRIIETDTVRGWLGKKPKE